MAVQAVAKPQKVQSDSSAVIELKALMKHVSAIRQELRRLAEAHNLDADRWGRADEAAGELDCAITDLVFDVQDRQG